MTYFVYILECADKTFYTGVAKDVAARVAAHNSERGGAKYTRSRRPVRLVYNKRCKDRSAAQRLEYALKQLSRSEKRRLIDVHTRSR